MLDGEIKVFAVGGPSLGIQELDLRGFKGRAAIAEGGQQSGHRNGIESGGGNAVLQSSRHRNARLIGDIEAGALLLNDFAVVGVAIEDTEAAADDGVVG